MEFKLEKVESSNANPARYISVRAFDESFSEPRLIHIDFGNGGNDAWVNLFGGYRYGGNHWFKLDDLMFAGIMPNDYEKVAEYLVNRFYKPQV